MIYAAHKGQTSYGEAIGIILMESFMPFPPGCPGNASSFSFPVRYAVVKGANMDRLVYQGDPAATQIAGWNEWVIDLTEFVGVDLTNVNTITIGIGTKGSPAAGGAGTMYFDDIRLVR